MLTILYMYFFSFFFPLDVTRPDTNLQLESASISNPSPSHHTSVSQPSNPFSYVMYQPISQASQHIQPNTLAFPRPKLSSDLLVGPQLQPSHVSQHSESQYNTTQLLSSAPYALFGPRSSLTTTHQICLQQHPGPILQATSHPSPYALFQPGSSVAPTAVLHSFQYSPVPVYPPITPSKPHQSTENQHKYLPHQPPVHNTLITAASTLAAAIGRSSSTPGLVESAGKVGLEEMILPPALHPLPPLARMVPSDHSQHHFLHHHQQHQYHQHRRSSPFSPTVSPTIR